MGNRAILTGVFYITLCSVGNAIAQDAPHFSMQRLDAIIIIKNQIKIAIAGKSITPDNQTLILKDVGREVDNDAPEILPSLLVSSTAEILNCALKYPLVISYSDKQYYRAAVRWYLYNVQLRMKYLEQHPPLTNEKIVAIRGTVSKAFLAVRAKMMAALLPMNISGITEQRIDVAIKNMAANLNDRVGNDPLFYQLTSPLSDSDTAALVVDFTDRLNDSIALVRNEIDQRTRQLPSAGDTGPAVNSVLDDVLRPVERAILDHTVDPERKNFDIRKAIAPGYQEAAKEYEDIVKNLTSENDIVTSPTSNMSTPQ